MIESPGYFVIKNYLSHNEVDELLENIENEKNEMLTYYDTNGNLRRAEKFLFLNDYFKNINHKIESTLKKQFNTEFVAFKDKINFKPPNGEGFEAHYDGVFKFVDSEQNVKNGWYEYSDEFVNVCLCLNDFTRKNGTLQFSEIHDENFETLYSKTKQDGSPILRKEIEDSIDFKEIELEKGDAVIFSHKTPHRSYSNNTNESRIGLYLTYNPRSNGCFYEKYFEDKNGSLNTKSKSL